MNPVEEFAASRDAKMTAADKDLRPLVAKALEGWSAKGDWYKSLIDDASVLWLEVFQEEAPHADPDKFMPRFHQMLTDSLSQTTDPGKPVDDAAINRVTNWLSAATINNATYLGNRAHGGAGMRWTTRHDGDVRDTHRAVGGTVAPKDGTFDVGGYSLHYPGEPVGPPEIWINCRCILTPARVEGALDVTEPLIADAAPAVAEPTDEEMIPDEPEDGEDLITEIPVHGVAAVEGRPTGDGRTFARDAISFADLPQPLGFEFESSHGGDNSRVAVIGRIDEYWKVDTGDVVEVRWRGVVHPDKPYAGQALDGILDGSYGGLSVVADSIALDLEATQMSVDDTPDGKSPVTHISEARLRRFDMVPTPAYQEAYIAMGPDFPDELTEDQLAALAACGCTEGWDILPIEEDFEDLDYASIELGYDVYRDVPTADRKKMAKSGTAMPDGSYPIANVDDLKNAIQAIGRAKNPAKVKAHIKKRAAALGKSDLIPDDWAGEFETFAPGTHDGPGWITHPVPTERIRRYWVRGKGAAKIRWGVPGDFNRCRQQLAKYVQNPEWLAGMCANMHKEAIGIWPGMEAGGRKKHGHHSTGAAPMSITASGVSVRPAEAFQNPQLTGPTPVTIYDDGRIVAHLATWGVCHIGITNTCVMAPHSATNYGQYRLGAVKTEEGTIAVGHITMGTGHASIKASAKDAVAHYDNTGTVVADVVAGEDAYGIWVAGLLRPGLSQAQIDALAASSLSGDWRMSGSGLELVAALAVNVPGFPVPRTALAASADFGEEALIAAGIVERDPLTASLFPSVDELAGIIRTAVDEYRHQEKTEERMSALAPWFSEIEEDHTKEIIDYFMED